MKTKLSPAEIRRKAKRINRRADLSKDCTLKPYSWGEDNRTMVKDGDRRVLDTLINSPIFCASPVRLSDAVLRLRRDHGLPVETERYTEERDGETLHFGVYFLSENVRAEAA